MKMHLVGIALCLLAHADVRAAEAQDDHLIVPRERVGAVRLGMSAGDLYQAMGEPCANNWYESEGGGKAYAYCDTAGQQVLLIYVAKASEAVVKIEVQSSAYRTVEGIGLGTSDLAIRAKLGKPQSEIGFPSDENMLSLCYKSLGLRINTNRGIVTSITLSAPKRVC